MEILSNITFLIPSTIEKLDQTAEPTLENLTGEDYLGNVIADTEQIVNAMDGYSNRAFQVDTGTDDAIWRIDTELDQRERAGFVMIDQHNLRNAYTAATKEQIDMHYYISDSFGSAIEVTMLKELSGELGHTQYINLDGVNDGVTIGDVEELDFGNGDFAIEIVFSTENLAKGQALFFKRSDFGGTKAGWILRFNDTGRISFIIGDAATNVFVSSIMEYCEDKVYHIIAQRDGDNLEIYVNGLLENTASGAFGLNVTVAQSARIGVLSGRYLQGNVYRARAWNRSLTQDEITGFSKNYSITDDWADGKDLLADSQATSDQLTEADSVVMWLDSEIAIDSATVGDDGVAPKAGTYKLAGLTTGTPPAQVIQAVTTVSGESYRFSGWLQDGNTATGALTIRVGTAGGLNDLGESTAVSVDDTWEYKQVDFTATGVTTYVEIRKVSTEAAKIYADDVACYPIGCVAEYDPSGINKGDGKWYDSSTNDLDGTIAGANYINVPNESDDYYLGVFDAEKNFKFWFTQFNADELTGVVDTLIGQVAFGKIYQFDTQLLPSGGFSGDYNYPGIIQNETDTGRFQTEEKFGDRPTWDLNFSLSSTLQFNKLREMVDYLKGSNYPFWICFNYDGLTPVVWRVRLEGGLTWGYQYGPVAQPWSPQIRLIKDI